MLEKIKTRSWLVATSVTIVVFVAISALALPTLETSLTFIPILGVSVFAGAISGFIVRKRARSGSRQRSELQFASDRDIESPGRELAKFVQNVMPKEEPAFVSDEATVWDISLSTEDELIGRCFSHYGVQLRAEDLKLPLSQLLPELKRRRTK